MKLEITTSQSLNLRQKMFLLEIRQLRFFDICAFSHSGLPTPDMLRPLHCINFDQMDDEMLSACQEAVRQGLEMLAN